MIQGLGGIKFLTKQEFDYQCKSALLHSKTLRFKDKLDKTKRLINDMLNINVKKFISLSCGKDSSVMADMILNIDNTIPTHTALTWESKLINDNINDVLDYFKLKGSVNITYSDFVTGKYKGFNFMDMRSLRKSTHNKRFAFSDCEGVFIGLRKQESNRRAMALSMFTTDGLPEFCYKYVTDKDEYGKRYLDIRMCPLGYWQTIDVAAYLVSNNIPVLNWYKCFGFDERTDPNLTPAGMQLGILPKLKIINLDGYNKIIERFPELLPK